MSMDLQLLYVNCATQPEAESIARGLANDKWVASASIVPNSKTFYWKDGRLAEGATAGLIMFCRRQHVGDIVNRIKSMSTEDCPCVVGMALQDGNPEYLEWMQRVLPAFLPQEATDGE